MIVKVCGMREAQNIRAVEAAAPDWMGFIFYPPSPRCVSDVPAYMPSRCRRTGVFVNAATPFILDKVARFGLDIVQLHGDEPASQCRALKAAGLTVVRAMSVSTPADVAAASSFADADFLLFDTPTAARGGSGRMFNWQLLDAYTGATPFILSGGITEAALTDIISFSHPRLAGIDLNSGFEIAPALKDAAALARFIAAVREAETSANQ